MEVEGWHALTWHPFYYRPPRPWRESLQPQGPDREQVRADPAGLDGEKWGGRNWGGRAKRERRDRQLSTQTSVHCHTPPHETALHQGRGGLGGPAIEHFPREGPGT